MSWHRAVLFGLFVLSCLSVSVLSAGDEKKEETKKDTPAIVEVKLKDLELKLPKTWVASDLVSSMRLATYEIPPVQKDKDKGEFVVFNFGGDGGGVAANLERWVGQFDADGREVTIRKGMAGDNTYHIADISGIYQKPVGPPVLRQTKPEKDYRMLGVILQIKDKGFYFLKLTGPDATVKAQAEVLRASFGAKGDGEEDYEL